MHLDSTLQSWMILRGWGPLNYSELHCMLDCNGTVPLVGVIEKDVFDVLLILTSSI